MRRRDLDLDADDQVDLDPAEGLVDFDGDGRPAERPPRDQDPDICRGRPGQPTLVLPVPLRP